MLRGLMLDNDFCLYYYFKYAFKLSSRKFIVQLLKNY